ncbi:dedicator of cytokinesis [Anaeramoeba flamelloides]|uniref:Dedicator of cytokinesis n=1 Tax=Anaeramoeba flamelloides TaxID=1746091 RepID=A0AAV7Z613_9EUKA|nr:dedicator of cytokinesis [Anaeramoeba flamelloides]
MTEFEYEERWLEFPGVCFTMHTFFGIHKDHLSLRTIGEPIVIEERYGELWLKGYTLITERRGIFPTNFVKIEPMSFTKEEFLSLKCHPIREFDPVILECEKSLKQWSKALLSNKGNKLKLKHSFFRSILQLMNQIMKLRGEFLDQNTPTEALFAIKHRIVTNLDQINRHFVNKQQIRRENGDPVLVDYLGISKVHEMYLQNCHPDSFAQTRATELTTSTNKYQILLDFKMMIIKMKDPYSVVFQIYSHQSNQIISESFTINMSGGLEVGGKGGGGGGGGGGGSTVKGGEVDKQELQKTIFMDLSEKEINSDLYLVAHIYRRGLFNKEEKKTKKKENWPEYRRPLGCSIHRLDKNFLQTSISQEQSVKLPIYEHPEETKFGKLHELIINKDLNLIQLESPYGVTVDLKTYKGDLDHVKQTYPDYNGTKLKNIPTTIKTSFPEVILPNYQRNDLYVTFQGCNMINAKKAKNLELRVIVRSRAESNNNNTNSSVNTNEKQTKEEPFFSKAISTGNASEKMDMYTSYVCGYRGNPKWNETIKINLTPQQYQNAELFIEIYSCQPNASQMHSVGIVRLTKPDQSVIGQGERKVNLYKWDPKLARKNPLYYLPNSKESQEKNSKIVIFENALTLNINFCSTNLTQQEKLIAFFNWRKNINNLDTVFKQLKYVSAIEKIKFIDKIFDTLFEIFGEKGNQFQERIFEEVLNVHEDIIKTQGFRSVVNYLLNEYYNVENTNAPIEIQKNFSQIYLPFVTTLTNVLKIEEGDKMRQVLQTMKGLELIFKLIGNSYGFHRKLNGISNSDENFKERFSNLMNLFSNFMSLTEPVWVKSAQNVALKHFKTLFADLLKIFDSDLIANLLTKMIKSVNVEGRDLMRRDKLVWIRSITMGELVEQSESRQIIIKVIKQQINSNILFGEKYLENCVSIINSLFIRTFEKAKKRDLNKWVTELLPFLNEIFRGLEYNDKLKKRIQKEQNKAIEEQQTNNKTELEKIKKLELKSEEIKKKENELETKNQQLINGIKSKSSEIIDKRNLIECSLISSFLSLFHVMNSDHILILLNNYSERIDDQTILLEKIFNLFLTILTQDKRLRLKIDDDLYESFGLPESTDLPMARYLIILETFKNISQILTESFLGENFKFKIWRLYILSLLEFISLKELNNKKSSNNYNNSVNNGLSNSSAKFIQEQYGDLREVAAIILENSWYSLDNLIIKFVPNEVEYFLNLLLLENEELVNYGFEFYFKMFLEEYRINGEISGIEQGTVAMVGNIIDTENDEIFIKNFFPRFEQKFEEWKTIKEQGKTFLDQLNQLIKRSSKLKDFRDTKFEEEKSQVLIDIIEYLFKTKRHQMFARYCQLLCNLHVQNKNFTEAGLSLLKLVKTLEWEQSSTSSSSSNDKSVDNNNKGNQRKFQTASKENLLKKTIDYLDKGKSWELAIKYLQPLKRYYIQTYNYSKLSHYISKESQFYKNIMTVDRFYATYFRVGYFGKGFEDEKYQGIKDQTFIYKGRELEKLPEFMDKLKIKYPNATYDVKDPTEEQKNAQGQYIQVCTVQPSSEDVILDKKITYSRSIPEKVLKHKMEGKVNVFVYSKPFRKSKIKSKNEFADLWIRNIYMIATDFFPTTCRRLKVKDIIIIEISPIQNGVNSIENKNEDLVSIITKYQTETIQNTNPFSMALNGVIDAAVNGGINMYVNAFLQEQYLDNYPKNEYLVIKMKQLLVNQLYILNVGLHLHNRLCPDNFRPFHDKMKIQFDDMNKKLESYLKGIKPDQIFK